VDEATVKLHVAEMLQLKALGKPKLQLPPKLEPKLENHLKLSSELNKKALEQLIEWHYIAWHSHPEAY